MNDKRTQIDDHNGILEIDRIIHEPARYLILANLYMVESMDYVFLKNQTGLTQGNLSSHLLKLEASGYLEITKEFVDRKPSTMLKISEAGKEAFEKYKRSMKNVLG